MIEILKQRKYNPLVNTISPIFEPNVETSPVIGEGEYVVLTDLDLINKLSLKIGEPLRVASIEKSESLFVYVLKDDTEETLIKVDSSYFIPQKYYYGQVK